MKKMDLGAFLADDTYGSSWADEEVDMSSIGVPISSTAAPVSSSYRPEFGAQDSGRADRTEYPVPDAPPYKARVANLPYDVEEGALSRFFEDRLQARDAVEEVKLPMDQMSGRPKGFAFVTFSERALLEEALNLTMSEFNGRKIFVNVAAPQKADVFDMDWRSARTGPVGGRDRREPREEVELDWGAARNSSGSGPSRDRGARGGDREFGERRPRRDEPDLDWGAARQSSAALPPRERGARGGDREFAERKPRRDEPDLDWGSARSAGPLPPRERENFRREGAPKKEQSDLDWSSARGSGVGAATGGANFRKKEEKEFDWKRGQALPPKSSSNNKAKKDDKEKDQPKPQKSVYDVLSLEGEESDAETETETKEDASKETGLEEKVSEISVNDGDWKTVGK
ncbi:hypothetical protein JCM33374_g4196 [Metschnikowia sp. JCM 33374]|nr:hypothetical protein JCM33374_g4196 [Metschnikowia sp. JCM 33374]